MDNRVFWGGGGGGLLLLTKVGAPEHIYIEIDKIAQPRCFVCHPRSVNLLKAIISAQLVEMAEN